MDSWFITLLFKATSVKMGQMDSIELREIQDKSMPELWQIANRLGISRKGKKAELIERILEAQGERDVFDRLRLKMQEFEKTREELKTLIESVSELAPKLDENKAALERSIREHQEKVSKVSDLIPKLEKEKEKLNEDILQLEIKISGFDEQIEQIQRAKESLLRE